MSEQEFIIALFAISSGVGLATFMFSQIFKIIRLGIEKKQGVTGDTRDMQLREEFVKFKKQTEQRIALLEVSHSALPKDETHVRKPSVELPEAAEEDGDRLPNMLRNRM
jgi:hypothetical protein